MADENYPSDLRYHRDHTWARIEGEAATFGITWFAQDSLGEVVFFDPPGIGQEVAKDESYAEVESVKAVSEVSSPLSGEVIEVNTALDTGVGVLNSDPYGKGWTVKVRMSDPGEADQLLTADEYRALLKG